MARLIESKNVYYSGNYFEIDFDELTTYLQKTIDDEASSSLDESSPNFPIMRISIPTGITTLKKVNKALIDFGYDFFIENLFDTEQVGYWKYFYFKIPKQRYKKE